jgi:hypothetical protein
MAEFPYFLLVKQLVLLVITPPAHLRLSLDLAALLGRVLGLQVAVAGAYLGFQGRALEREGCANISWVIYIYIILYIYILYIYDIVIYCDNY